MHGLEVHVGRGTNQVARGVRGPDAHLRLELERRVVFGVPKYRDPLLLRVASRRSTRAYVEARERCIMRSSRRTRRGFASCDTRHCRSCLP